MKKFFKFPLLIVIAILTVTVILGIQIKDLVIDNNTNNFLPVDDPARVEYKTIEDQYGGGMIMALSVTVKDGLIYDQSNLKKLALLSEKIEAIPNITHVISIINADYILGTPEGIETQRLVSKIPENRQEEEEVKNRLTSWKMYKGSLYTDDFKSTMIAIKLSLGAQNKTAEKAYHDLKQILAESKDNGFEYHIAGLPAVLVIMTQNMRLDLVRLIPFVVIILLLTLFLSFRSIGGVILPTITVLISTVCTLGLMAIFHVNLTMVASAIPILLIAVGSAYGIHIISHYFDELEREKKLGVVISLERNSELVFLTLKRVGGAVFLAALTTIAGFGSLATSKIVPLKNFGIFTAIGVVIALIIAVTFIPAILILWHKPLKHKTASETNTGTVKKDPVTHFLMFVHQHIIKNKILTVTITLIILAVSIIGSSRLLIGNPMINYFRKGTEVRRSDDFLNKRFSGTTLVDVVVKGQNPGDLTNPDILVEMDKMSDYLVSKYPEIGNIMSYTDLIKKMNQVMNADESGDYYEIPADPVKYHQADKNGLKQLIAQYLMLFSGNIEEYTDDSIEPSQTKMTVMLKSADFDLIRNIKKDITEWSSSKFPEGYQVVVSGNSNLQVAVSNLIIESQISNILTSLLAVFVILAIYFRSGWAGLLGVITLGIPIFLNFGLMGLLGIRLDAGTAMVAALAIGIGIDYTIHFMNAYHHERKLSDDLSLVTERSLLSSGKAIIFNAIAVALGFVVMMFSNFMPLVHLGGLVALTMVTSSFAAMTLLPVMLNIFKPKFISR